MYIPAIFQASMKQQINRSELRRRSPVPEDGSDHGHPINQVGPSFDAPVNDKSNQDKIAWIVFGVSIAVVIIIAIFIWHKNLRRWFQRRAGNRAEQPTDPEKASEIVVEKPSELTRSESELFTVITLPNTPPSSKLTPPGKLSGTTTASQNIDPWYTRMFRFGRTSKTHEPTVIHVEVERIAEVNGEARTPARWSLFAFSPAHNGSLGFGNSRRS